MKIGLNNYEYISPLYLYHEKRNHQDNNYYIKRDDMIPFSFGGNKARMVMQYFMDLKDKNCDSVVTYGGTSSNLCRIIANMASQNNYQCYVIAPNELSYETNNSRMIKMFGANYIFCDVSEVHHTIEETMQDLTKQGKTPYFIPGGGHGLIGTEACLDLYDEIRDYETETGVSFDYIFLTSGTGTTQSGLVLGKIIHNDTCEIIGISEARENPRGRQVVVDSINDFLISKSIQCDEKLIQLNVNFLDEYTCGGYGKYNKEVATTVQNVMIRYGIPLDPVYTGKGYHGMMEYILKNEITNKDILFVHTGGTPLFFDYLSREELVL